MFLDYRGLDVAKQTRLNSNKMESLLSSGAELQNSREMLWGTSGCECTSVLLNVEAAFYERTMKPIRQNHAQLEKYNIKTTTTDRGSTP